MIALFLTISGSISAEWWEGLVMLNKKGISLVEIMIALVVLLLVSLALMQTALVSIDSNMNNLLRDEALSIAEEWVIRSRNIPFDNLTSNSLSQSGTGVDTITRNFRNITNQTFTVTSIVTDRGIDNKQVGVTVAWTWKAQPFNHNMSSIVRRP
jgi:type IV pilus assembly protein PilV